VVWRSGAERSCKEKVRFFVGEAVGSVYEIRRLAFEVHGLVPCPEYRLGYLGLAVSQVAQGAGRGLYHLFFERWRLVYRCGLYSGGICRSRGQSYRTIAAGPAREHQREIKVCSITISETDLDCGLCARLC
jgi:hypothetical protein